MKYIIYLFITFFCINSSCLSQNIKHKLYLENIVQIEDGTYGLIIGTENSTIYFITIAANENFESLLSLKVRFYKDSDLIESKAILNYRLDEYRVCLYSCNYIKHLDWKKFNYNSYFKSNAPYYSFLADLNKEAIWFANPNEFRQYNSNRKRKIILSTDKVLYGYQGMPIIDNYNSIVGIIAEKPNSSGLEPFVSVIDIMSIANLFYNETKCNYFQLVEYGQPATPCEISNSKIKDDRKKLREDTRANKAYKFTYGISFGADLNFSTSNDGSESIPNGYGFSTGLSLFFNPDIKNIRVTLKPRIFTSDIKFSSTSSINYTITKYSLKHIEVPIVVESIFSRSLSGNTYWGIGYSPGFQYNLKYFYNVSISSGTYEIDSKAYDNEKLTHKAIAIIGIEEGTVRLDLFASYLFNPWHNSNSYIVGRNIITPFANISNRYLTVGLDFSIRINGTWGLKKRK